MNTRYFFSAEEAAEQLGLPLLLATTPFPGVPRIGLRLSEQAPDPILGARIYHRLDVSNEAIHLVIWVASPWETSEHLAWAIALAEQAARAGRVAYLVDLDRASTLRPLTRGPGRPVPVSMERRLSAWGVVGAAAWSSDLQGVRIVLPTDQPPKRDRLEDGEWTVLLSGALPDEREEIKRIGSDADRVVLATGFRDHPSEELKAAVEALRDAGALLVGLVAMGPISRRGRSALDHGQPVGESPLESKPEVPKASEARPVRAKGERPGTGDRVKSNDSRPPTPVPEGRVESMLPLPGTAGRETVPEPPREMPVSEPEPRQEPRPEPRREPSPEAKPEPEPEPQPEQTDERKFDAEPESTVAQPEPKPEPVEHKPATPSTPIEPEERPKPTPKAQVPPAPVHEESFAPAEMEAHESTVTAGEDRALDEQPAPLETEPEEIGPPQAEESRAVRRGRSTEQQGTVDLFAAWNRRRQPARMRPRLLVAAILVAVLAGAVWLSDSFGLLPFKILGPSSSDLEAGGSEPPAVESVETGGGDELGESAPFSTSDSVLQGGDLALEETPLREEEDGIVGSQQEVLPEEETTESIPDAVTTPAEVEPRAEPTIPEKAPETQGEPGPVEETEPELAIVDRTVRWEDAFVVHVSSFRGALDADTAAANLKDAGLPARVVTVVLPDRGRWERVVVGAYPDSQAAGRVAQRLRAEGLVSFAQILGNGGAGNARYIGQR